MPSRRVSYVIPAPTHPPPRLSLPSLDTPRNGKTGPLLIPIQDPTTPVQGHRSPPTSPVPSVTNHSTTRAHPQHRLGVASLVLDTSTQLAGRSGPEGILYSGGRDGLVIAWELGISMKKRATRYGKGSDRRSRWDVLTGWGDEDDQDEDEETDDQMVIPYEHRWETDLNVFQAGKPSNFRQSVQSHTDWVNDIVLCNLNQTLVSASNDGTLKAWNPHDPTTASHPHVVGTHGDYVRCLAHSHSQGWVASGAADRLIKLWDIQAQSKDPIITFTPADGAGPKSSIYALATDPTGNIVASGSPERVVRTWDPRSGKRTGKLVGHTENIRSILISDDGRYLLTGSADASIKLWSLATSRCLHTFAHHTESVWSLFSAHPNLEIFYSGDRSGTVCKVDMESCSELAEGECIVLSRETRECTATVGSEGINKIIAMDDNLLWTATGSSTIKRWRVPARRVVRAGEPIPIMDLDRDSPLSSPTKASPFSEPLKSSPFSEGVKSPSSPRAGFSYDPLRSPRTGKRDSFITRRESLSRHESQGQPRRESLSRHDSPKPDSVNRRDSSSHRKGESPVRKAESPTPIEFMLPNRGQSDSPTPSFSRQIIGRSDSPTPSFSRQITQRSAITIPGRSSASFVSEVSTPVAGVTGGAETTLFGIPFQSLVKLAIAEGGPYSVGGAGTSLMRGGKDAEVATMYSAASVMSVHIPRPFHTPAPTTPAAVPTAAPLSPSTIIPHARRSFTVTEAATAATMFGSSSSPTGMSTRFMNMYGIPGDAATTHNLQLMDQPPPDARQAYEEREVAVDAVPLNAYPDEVILGSHGVVRSIILNDRVHALTVDTAGEVKVWDIIRGICLGVFSKEEIASTSSDSILNGSGSANGSANGSGTGKGVGAGAASQRKEKSPREALEIVREHIEGEAVVTAWATVDTLVGDLTVHMLEGRCFEAEIYADEAGFGEEGMKLFEDEARLNVGKWILSNLFTQFVQKAIQINTTSSPSSPTTIRFPPTQSGIYRAPAPTHIQLRSRSNPDFSDAFTLRSTPFTIGRATPFTGPVTPALAPDLPRKAQTHMHLKHALSPPFLHVAGVEDSGPLSPILDTPSITGPPAPGLTTMTPRPRRSQTVDEGALSSAGGSPTTPDYFSIARRSSVPESEPGGPTEEGAVGTATTPAAKPDPAPPTPSGGFMGRLKMFGKGAKKPAGGETPATPSTAAPIAENETAPEEVTQKPASTLAALLSQQLHPPNMSEAPPLSLSPYTTILISEADQEAASGWRTTYSGSVASTGGDMKYLEENAPDWLLEYLLAGKLPAVQTPKFSFVVLPWKGGKPGDALPEMPNAVSRLTASKTLRIRKILTYIRDKLDSLDSTGTPRPSADIRSAPAANSTALTSVSNTTSTPAATASNATTTLAPGMIASPPRTPSGLPSQDEGARRRMSKDDRPKGEELYELLCNDMLLPNHMTLAAVKQFVWRQSSEVVMYYRKKGIYPE